ncbi:MAG: 16S rRNA (adenine(1518)-N(6)/adenine(1519)-N(6))-dimethyltransferase RsmA [bacterium]
MPHQPRKRFGQNFLHDPSVIAKIVAAIAPAEGQNLLEIGPGQGAITCELLRKCSKMYAIELDRDLIEPLKQKCAPIGELNLHSADALKFDFRQLATDAPLRVVGNLPYNISTPLLFHLLEQAEAIQDMHFMLQKEVVDRMAAAPGSKTYGRLSVMLQVNCEVTPLFDIKPGAFNPPPKVMSSLVRLVPAPDKFSVKNPTVFAQIVREAFNQRRKTLRNALKKTVAAPVFVNAGIDPASRAEQLSPADFVQLANAVEVE